jgi:hypothetical protein
MLQDIISNAPEPPEHINESSSGTEKDVGSQNSQNSVEGVQFRKKTVEKNKHIRFFYSDHL